MTSSEEQSGRRVQVLLVEDHPVHQMLGRRLLEQLGWDVQLAENGEEAVNMVQQHKYDVVLMDVEMPVMTGLEATQTIRQAEASRGGHIPIIAVTASEDPKSCLRAGMDAMLPKPLNLDRLQETLDQLGTSLGKCRAA